MSEKDKALRLADDLRARIEYRPSRDSTQTLLTCDDAARCLEEQHAEIELLREENRLWKSRCIALVWKGDTDNITAGRLESAAKEIDAALRREDGA